MKSNPFLSLKHFYIFFWGVFFAPVVFGEEEIAVSPKLLVREEMVLKALAESSNKAEKKLKDLLRADYHQALAFYYLGREKSGFMALERCDLAFERAIGDIREGVLTEDEEARKKKILTAFHNWQRSLQKARFKNIPEKAD